MAFAASSGQQPLAVTRPAVGPTSDPLTWRSERTIDSRIARRVRIIAVQPPGPGLAPIASALLPGSGQYVLGQDRFVAYAAIEIFTWLRLRNDRADQARQEALFHDLARSVARANFSPNRPDGDWAYYEHMRDYLESGAYSLSGAGPLVPEVDTVTYNGALWRDVKRHNPDLASALAEYQTRAVQPDFLWSWRNAQLQWDSYKRTTDQRNDAAGRITYDLMVIGANHMLSMVDAFAMIRLRARPRLAGGLDISATLSVPGFLRARLRK